MGVTCAFALRFALLLPTTVAQVEFDAWSNEVNVRTPAGWYAAPIHAALLADGRVVMIGRERNAEDPLQATETRKCTFTIVPTPLDAPVPSNQVVTLVDAPLDFEDYVSGSTTLSDDLYCCGLALTAKGQVFTAGGTRVLRDLSGALIAAWGLPYAMIYDGFTWSRVPEDMAVVSPSFSGPARWYGAVTRLHDGRMLVTGGYDAVSPAPVANLSAEIFDPETGSWSILADYGEAPAEIFNIDYTQPAVLPTRIGAFDLLVFGEAGLPVLLSLKGTQRWSVLTKHRPGRLPRQLPNQGASSALLPIRLESGEWGYSNGSMLIAGGIHATTHQRKIDVYDPVVDAWLPRVEMRANRTHPTVVLLPDGRVAIVAGHSTHGDTNTRRATYVDPSNGFSSSLGNSAAAVVRGYHSIALLLPDGRLLVGGGRDNDAATTLEKPSIQYLYPPYMFLPRPIVERAPDEIGYGEVFAMTTGGEPASEAVLMSLGSMTHSFDFNQRCVQLKLARAATSSGSSRALPTSSFYLRAPPDGRVAPPGYYMLFIVGRNGAPSVAPIVHLH